jgi:hypothetical protein
MAAFQNSQKRKLPPDQVLPDNQLHSPPLTILEGIRVGKVRALSLSIIPPLFFSFFSLFLPFTSLCHPLFPQILAYYTGQTRFYDCAAALAIVWAWGCHSLLRFRHKKQGTIHLTTT